MAKEETEILICQATRKNMQVSFMWPSLKDELNPGRSYYTKVFLFLLIYVVMISSTLIHLLVTVINNIDVSISEDIGCIGSMSGIWYMATIYIRNQPNIAALLRDLSRFENFGKPPNFDETNQKLNFWSWLAFLYPTFGSTTCVFMKLQEKPECEAMNEEKNLNEHCGLMYPFWLPFDINYFPVFYIFFVFVWIATMLFVRLHLAIFFQALEIATHIILRIEHLSFLMMEVFDEPGYKTCREKLTRCIHYHQEILEMSTRLDEAFSGLMFLHFVMTATICGCLEKQFVDGVYPVAAAVHLMGWITSLFIASLGGQKIVDANEAFTAAVYSSKWYLADTKLQKDVMFLLERAQKGIYMNVGAFGILSFEFFLGVLKMSYSVLAMLTS